VDQALDCRASRAEGRPAWLQDPGAAALSAAQPAGLREDEIRVPEIQHELQAIQRFPQAIHYVLLRAEFRGGQAPPASLAGEQ
jgi:hypothetical protein